MSETWANFKQNFISFINLRVNENQSEVLKKRLSKNLRILEYHENWKKFFLNIE